MNTSEKLGRESIPRLLVRFAVPAIVGMLANALYNIVDRIFIGHAVGPLGIAGISVVFPFMIVAYASAVLAGVGASSLISISLGERRHDRAERALGNGWLVLVSEALLLVAAGYAYRDAILRSVGTSDTILPYAREYFDIILWGVPFAIVGAGMAYCIRAEGRPRFASATLVIGAISNVALDALFIQGFGMGLRGAALGTIIAQGIAAAWALSFYARERGGVRFRFSNLVPEIPTIGRIIAVGSVPALVELTFTFIIGLVNRHLAHYGGDLAVSAMGIFFSLDSLLFVPVFGIGEALQPIVGFNYGARNTDRVIRAVKLALVGATIYYIGSFAVVMAAPDLLIRLFTTQSDLIALSVRCLRIGYSGVMFAGCSVIASFFFQGLGKARQGMILSVARQFVFFIPPLFLLPQLFGVDGVYLTFPCADIGGGLLSLAMLRRQLRSLRGGSGPDGSDAPAGA
jgi:putative MATE family efflux protein